MSAKNCKNPIHKPFLRWAGGKTHLVPLLLGLAPPDVNRGTYWEPFLGAGNLFFALRPLRAVLSDRNADLIMCFRAVREHPDLIYEYLQLHGARTSTVYYYTIRQQYNQSKDSVAKSAMFIYLNKTCFNGIWRVNKKGEFNVPYGHKEPPALPSRADLLAASSILENAELKVGDFRDVLADARAGDFVYLDPPYPPLNETACFVHYTQERFCMEDQIAVAEMATTLDKRGCRVLISNADTEFIRSLYDNFQVLEQGVTRWIRTDGKRYRVNEIVALNYDIVGGSY
jgi:DNA adenine methylase